MLELFSGMGVMSRTFKKHGWETFTIDWDNTLPNVDLCADVGKLSAEDIITLCGEKPTVIWASPDCTTYSVMSFGTHRQKVNDILYPISEYAEQCDRTNTHLIKLIEELNPKYFFIENPRGGLRKMPFMLNAMDKGLMKRYTITYCQYGDVRQKPTDIWTNHPDPQFKPPCKPNAPCHEHAPRGTTNGTQRINGSRYRAMLPIELCEHIVNICDSSDQGKSGIKTGDRC